MLYFHIYKAIQRKMNYNVCINKVYIYSFIFLIIEANCLILNDSYATNNISLKNDKNAEILQLKKSLKDLNDSNPYQLDDYYQIPINDILFPLQIQTNNHNPINNIDFDEKSKTINIFINPLSSTNNKIDIGIPRSILDSKTIEGKDKNFNVTINNKPVKFLEINNTDKRHNYISNDEMKRTGNLTTNTDNRNLIIDFDKNSKIIRITGTNISTLKNIQQNGEKHTEESIKFIITIFSIICGIGIGLGYFISRKRKYSFVKKSQNK